MSQQKITKGLFWFAFCAFLAVSIPHVAWMYASFEPSSFIWWGIAYLVAVGIDVLVCWVSYVLSRGNRLDKALFGTFIAVLLAWSYFANYLYAMAHTPYQTINVWTIPLVFGLTTGTVAPYIIAAAPLFAIGYTFMLGKVGQENTEKLEEKVARLESEKELKQRLAIAQQGRFTGLIKSAIGGVADVTSYAYQTLKPAPIDQPGDVSIEQITPAPIFDIDQSQDGLRADIVTDKLTIQNGHKPDTETDLVTIQNGYSPDAPTDVDAMFNEHSPDAPTDIAEIDQAPDSRYSNDTDQDREPTSQTDGSGYDNSVPARSTRPVYVSVKEAVTTYGYAETYLVKLVQRGAIKTKRGDRTQLLVSSVEAYIAKNGRRKQSTETRLPTLSMVS